MDSKPSETCNWGFSEDVHGDDAARSSGSQRFFPVYKNYIENKSSLNSTTPNEETFASNPRKALEDWFSQSGEEFKPEIEEIEPKQYSCTIEIPLDRDLFEVHSEEPWSKKADAINDTCLRLCRLLDKAGLLHEWQNDNLDDTSKRKASQKDSHSDDDIELDETLQGSSKKLKPSQKETVHNYDSLMADWSKVNLEILKEKAQLVKIDLSVNSENQKTVPSDDEDEDPLDAYMKTVDNKSELTLKEKIEKAQIKIKIQSLEKEKIELQRLIEIAKPRFDMKKLISKDPASG